MATLAQVKNYLDGQGIAVLEFEQETATSESAAQTVGCTAAEIAKTLLFIVGGQPVVVVTCGDTKVKSSSLKKASGLSGKVKFPQAGQVVLHTGYTPGGVCPFLLPADLPIYLDRSMARFDRVYAAAGNCHTAVPVTLDQLEWLTGGEVVQVCELVAAEERIKNF
jgi:prolyl-tRNA editing enzyme YbaK/EbsC (Cys-tRNA(Pro) deacylase)